MRWNINCEGRGGWKGAGTKNGRNLPTLRGRKEVIEYGGQPQVAWHARQGSVQFEAVYSCGECGEFLGIGYARV